MEQYLIDTNVVSDYFSASFPAASMTFMDTAYYLALTCTLFAPRFGITDPHIFWTMNITTKRD